MPPREFVYVDGESHFIRSEVAWCELHGENARLDRLRYFGQPDEHSVLVNPKAKVFWTRRMNPGAERTTYFTAAVGDEPALHQLKVALRNFGVEGVVIAESRQRADNRKNVLRNEFMIEKPKGVDIALTVRMIEDAQRQLFDICHLYTSDADFVPVIDALKVRGTRVYVHGFKNGLSQQSPLLYVPDMFVDLEETLRIECELIPPP